MSATLTLNKGENIITGTVYSYDEVLHAAIEYFHGDELAATTWMNKYAVKDAKGHYYEQTPDDMHRRMAREFVESSLAEYSIGTIFCQARHHVG